MAYEGEIEWSNAVHFHSTSELHKEVGGLRQRDNAISVELKALARESSLDEKERRLLMFDKSNRSDIRRLRCIVIGRKHGPSDEHEHCVLVVEPVSGKISTYERVGVRCIQMRNLLNGSEVEVRIV